MINWRDAATNPPTRDESTTTGFVIIQDRREQCGFRGVHLDQVRASDKWCQHRDVKAIIEATFDQPDSPWVFAKDRMPTKEDDGDFVLWMRDEYDRPVVLRIESFGQSVATENNNLRWCRIPPCPPPLKRELPAKAVNKEECPCKVTLRNGDHAQAVYRRDENEDKLWLVSRNGDVYIYWWSMEGKQLSWNGGARTMDIVHVGGWLSKQELEALKNGI